MLCKNLTLFVTVVDTVAAQELEILIYKRCGNILLLVLVHGSRHDCIVNFFAMEYVLKIFTCMIGNSI